MSDTKPRESETTAPKTGDGTPPSAPGRTGDKTEKQDAPFVWPRDLNAPSGRSASARGARSRTCAASAAAPC